MITIYTDGSSRGNPGPGGWAGVLIYDKNDQAPMSNDQWVTEIGGREEHTTNNRMELTAAIESLELVSKLVPSAKPLEASLYTDSEYVMKGITEWVHNWQKKGWRTANKKPVLNQDLWQRLLEVTEGKNIEWKYVAGHAGVDLNERADVIATEFADGLNPSLYNGPREKYK
ncbi:MAG: ribonuclease HI [Minisyncoccia bacterium]